MADPWWWKMEGWDGMPVVQCTGAVPRNGLLLGPLCRLLILPFLVWLVASTYPLPVTLLSHKSHEYCVFIIKISLSIFILRVWLSSWNWICIPVMPVGLMWFPQQNYSDRQLCTYQLFPPWQGGHAPSQIPLPRADIACKIPCPGSLTLWWNIKILVLNFPRWHDFVTVEGNI